ncbi:MAG: hypothetical protein Q4C96_06035 [Planctomycetia bacterium]|nr:hypothetical protein [Planctomycetia bacterium]
MNINGLINIDTHATCVDFPVTVNAKTTIRLFKKLISRHDPKTVIHVFVDNARYDRAALLREFYPTRKFVCIFYQLIRRT